MFINRGENDKITALFANQQYEGQEWLDDYNAEVINFGKPTEIEKALEKLKAEHEAIAIISTSVGDLSLKTPVGDISVVMIGLVTLNMDLPEGTLRLANGKPVSAMTAQQVKALYLEVFNAINALDKDYTAKRLAILEG